MAVGGTSSLREGAADFDLEKKPFNPPSFCSLGSFVGSCRILFLAAAVRDDIGGGFPDRAECDGLGGQMRGMGQKGTGEGLYVSNGRQRKIKKREVHAIKTVVWAPGRNLKRGEPEICPPCFLKDMAGTSC